MVIKLYARNRPKLRHASSGRGVDHTELLVVSRVKRALFLCRITPVLHSV